MTTSGLQEFWDWMQEKVCKERKTIDFTIIGERSHLKSWDCEVCMDCLCQGLSLHGVECLIHEVPGNYGVTELI